MHAYEKSLVFPDKKTPHKLKTEELENIEESSVPDETFRDERSWLKRGHPGAYTRNHSPKQGQVHRSQQQKV
jgi:hypothetical protein